MSDTLRTVHGAHTAERWRRVSATVLDLALACYVGFLVGLLVIDVGNTNPNELLTRWGELAGALGSLPGAVALALFLVGIACCWHRLGGSPGMLLMGCVVVDSRSGKRLSLARSLWRAVALMIALAPLGLGYLWFLVDGRRQGLHDKLARSDVVLEDESLLPLDELMGKFS